MKFNFLIIFLILLTGCAVKTAFVSHPVVLTYQSKNYKLNDTAFFYTDSRNNFKIEIYTPVAYKLEIGKKVCLDGRCMSKKQFNSYELSEHYPLDLITDVLNGRVISDLIGSIEETNDGFVQKASNSHYDITYTKTASGVVFRDRLNKITVAIKDLQ